MTVFGQNYQITIIPPNNINIPLQAVRSFETDIIPPETESSEAISTTEHCFMSRRAYYVCVPAIFKY